MPAITLGLAEVEERLRALRRRLNAVTLQHSVYLAVSAAIAVLTAVIVFGLRASASSFRIAAYGGTLLVILVAAACADYARRHWLTAQNAAHLVDRRAQLTDRLATLVDLRLRPRPTRFAPILVAQALALGARWRMEQIVPRRIPRSVSLVVIALLALAGTAFLARRQSPSASSPAATEAVRLAAANPAAAGGRLSSGTGNAMQPDTPGALQPPGTLLNSGDLPASGAGSGSDQGSSPDPNAASASGKGGASLTDRLQQTIRHAFRPDAPEQPSQLASGAGEDSRRGSGSKPDPNAPSGRGDRSNAGTDTSNNPSGQKGTGQSPFGKQEMKNQSGANAPQTFQGSSPSAGTGSSPQGLMDPNAPAVPGGQGEPKRFKLAITSFLHPVPQQGQLPRPDMQPGAAGEGATGSGAEVGLNEQQLADDAVRKAEVPAEYEDLVRRVYSQREQ